MRRTLVAGQALIGVGLLGVAGLALAMVGALVLLSLVRERRPFIAVGAR